MRHKPALHTVQDLGKACENLDARLALQQMAETWIDWQQMQADAVEDGDSFLAAHIGRQMKSIRLEACEKFGTKAWRHEIEKTGGAQ